MLLILTGAVVTIAALTGEVLALASQCSKLPPLRTANKSSPKLSSDH